MWIRRVVYYVVVILATSGCTTLFRSDIERDRNKLTTLSRSLACGMTEAEVNKRVGGTLEKMGAPHERLTHIYRLQFADLWLVIDQNGLQASQIHTIDGMTSYAAEPQVRYCKN